MVSETNLPGSQHVCLAELCWISAWGHLECFDLLWLPASDTQLCLCFLDPPLGMLSVLAPQLSHACDMMTRKMCMFEYSWKLSASRLLAVLVQWIPIYVKASATSTSVYLALSVLAFESNSWACSNIQRFVLHAYRAPRFCKVQFEREVSWTQLQLALSQLQCDSNGSYLVSNMNWRLLCFR